MGTQNRWIEYSDYIPVTLYSTKTKKSEVYFMNNLLAVNIIGKTRSAQSKDWDAIIKAVNGKAASEVAVLLNISKVTAGHYIRQTRKAKEIAIAIEAKNVARAKELYAKHTISATDDKNVLAILVHFYGSEVVQNIVK